MERTASQQFPYEINGRMYQQRHHAFPETEETALINSNVHEVCPHCQLEPIKRFGKTSNHSQHYRCLGCEKTFTPVTGTFDLIHTAPSFVKNLMTAIRNVFSKREPCSPDGYAIPQPSFVTRPLTKSRRMALLRQMGYLSKDDNPPPVAA